MLPAKFDMAVKLLDWGDASSAATILEDCARSAPQNELIKFVLGETYSKLGRIDDAIKAYRDYLELTQEDSLGANPRLHLLGQAPMPAVLPAAYVHRLFDDYAEGFEKMLLGPLAYKAPTIVAQAVAGTGTGPFASVLDLGCGTGLSAEPFKNATNVIDGVDISPCMLEKARAKNIYANLHEADIEAWLGACTASYNLVLCMDTLVYIGALENLFQEIAGVMAMGGVFAFTTQASTGKDYVLGVDLKFSHTNSYVKHCSERVGLKTLAADACVPRLDHGEPVSGMVFVCRK